MEQLSGNSNAGRGVAEGHSPAALWPHPTVNIYISTIHIYHIYILNTASASQLSRDAMFPAWREWQTWQRWYTQTPRHIYIWCCYWCHEGRGMCHPKDAIYSIYAHLNRRPLVHQPLNREKITVDRLIFIGVYFKRLVHLIALCIVFFLQNSTFNR